MRVMLACTVALLAASVVVAQDKKDDELPPIPVVKLERKEPISYEKDVEPILVDKCIRCHGGLMKEGKLDMNSYDSLIKGGKSGKAVVPGRPGDSLIIKYSGRTSMPYMPPPKKEKPLSPEQLAILTLWVEQGA